MASSGYSPADPVAIAAAFEAAEAESKACVDDPVQPCEPEKNWTETGLIDESTGEPIPNIPYKIYDAASDTMVASGTLDENGKSGRHDIPMKYTDLKVLFGTEAAIEEARDALVQQKLERALKNNAVASWKNIPAGLDREAFGEAYDEAGASADRSYIGTMLKLQPMLLPQTLTQALLTPRAQKHARDQEAAWNQYQVATGARPATRAESFIGGVEQGISFGLSEEMMSGVDAVLDARPYDDIIAERRTTITQQKTAHSGYFMGGELVGAIPTIFIPVGGAAANSARAAQGSAKVVAGMKGAAKAGAPLGAVDGFGRAEGTFVERLDDAAIGAAMGGIGGALAGGAGVAIARGVSKTRIWAKLETRALGGKGGRGGANSISPGGNGKAISGHGEHSPADGFTKIPEGTKLITPKHDIELLDATGQVMEKMDVEKFVAADQAGRRKIAEDMMNDLGFKDAHLRDEVLAQIDDMRVLEAGEMVENYTIFEPSDLNIFENSTTVGFPKKLDGILEENLGTCAQATCTVIGP